MKSPFTDQGVVQTVYPCYRHSIVAPSILLFAAGHYSAEPDLRLLDSIARRVQVVIFHLAMLRLLLLAYQKLLQMTILPCFSLYYLLISLKSAESPPAAGTPEKMISFKKLPAAVF